MREKVMKISVITHSFKASTKDSLITAGKIGLDGVQIYATVGDFSPEVLTPEDIAEYKQILKDSNLVVSALCGDMGGHGFEIAADNPERIEKTKRIIVVIASVPSFAQAATAKQKANASISESIFFMFFLQFGLFHFL